jgi:regulator of sigma E protease
MIDFIESIPVIGSPLISILPFLIIITIVVFVHEYGHYIIGRLCGVHAEVFSVGMGPAICSWQDKNGTLWQIAAIPLGGYVKFLGDKNVSSFESDQLEKDKSFNNASLTSKTLTVLAGPIANFLLSFFIFTSLLLWHGKPSNEPIIGNMHTAFSNGYNIKKDDIIISINDRNISNFSDIYSFMYEDNSEQFATYVLERKGKQINSIGPFPSVAIIGSVMPVSPASSAGLKSGDLITNFNGVPITSFKQLQKLITTSKSRKQSITVFKRWRINKPIHYTNA